MVERHPPSSDELRSRLGNAFRTSSLAYSRHAAVFLSVDMRERLFGRSFRRHANFAHRHGLQVMHQTCWTVAPLIPKFIEAGLETVQSLQPRAANKDLAVLKREYGNDLVFRGSIDIQQRMPRDSLQNARNVVRHPVEAAMPGGGFIRCAAHNTWRDAPLSKVVALSEAYHECGAYRDR